MSTSRTTHTAPAKSVLEMTDKELSESYLMFFPDGQPQEQEKLGHYATEFEKISLVRDVPVRYAIHSQMITPHA